MNDRFAARRLICLLGLIVICSLLGTARAQVQLPKDFYPGGSGFARYVFDTGADVLYVGLYSDTGTMELWKIRRSLRGPPWRAAP